MLVLIVAAPALHWCRDFSRSRAGHGKAGAVPYGVLMAQSVVGLSSLGFLICLLCNHHAGEGAAVGSGGSGPSLGTTVLNAEAGAPPSLSWEHLSGAGAAPLAQSRAAELPRALPTGEQGVSEPSDITLVNPGKTGISSLGFFSRCREGRLSPLGGGGQWSCPTPHPFEPSQLLHVGVSSATPVRTRHFPHRSQGAKFNFLCNFYSWI